MQVVVDGGIRGGTVGEQGDVGVEREVHDLRLQLLTASASPGCRLVLVSGRHAPSRESLYVDRHDLLQGESATV